MDDRLPWLVAILTLESTARTLSPPPRWQTCCRSAREVLSCLLPQQDALSSGMLPGVVDKYRHVPQNHSQYRIFKPRDLIEALARYAHNGDSSLRVACDHAGVQGRLARRVIAEPIR
jgi:hypothetical protein